MTTPRMQCLDSYSHSSVTVEPLDTLLNLPAIGRLAYAIEESSVLVLRAARLAHDQVNAAQCHRVGCSAKL